MPNNSIIINNRLILKMWNNQIDQIIEDPKKHNIEKIGSALREVDSKQIAWLRSDYGISAKCGEWIQELNIDGTWFCSCPDFQYRARICKHLAVLSHNCTKF